MNSYNNIINGLRDEIKNDYHQVEYFGGAGLNDWVEGLKGYIKNQSDLGRKITYSQAMEEYRDIYYGDKPELYKQAFANYRNCRGDVVNTCEDLKRQYKTCLKSGYNKCRNERMHIIKPKKPKAPTFNKLEKERKKLANLIKKEERKRLKQIRLLEKQERKQEQKQEQNQKKAFAKLIKKEQTKRKAIEKANDLAMQKAMARTAGAGFYFY